MVIDVQNVFDEVEQAGTARDNPEAVCRIADLLAVFRGSKTPVIHIRHGGTDSGSRFHPTQSGYRAPDEAREHTGEAVLVKHVDSAFIGTDLDRRLRTSGVSSLVIVGATTNRRRSGFGCDLDLRSKWYRRSFLHDAGHSRHEPCEPRRRVLPDRSEP